MARGRRENRRKQEKQHESHGHDLLLSVDTAAVREMPTNSHYVPNILPDMTEYLDHRTGEEGVSYACKRVMTIVRCFTECCNGR